MTLPEDLSRCLVLNTVAAARNLLRHYDAALKPFGVTVQQFALLAALRYNPNVPVAALAERVRIDRTSLTRNLDLLERKGLVRRTASGNAKTRTCEPTAPGDALLDRLLIEWKAAQTGLLAGVAPADADAYLGLVDRFSKI